jgi:hypothetical protein
MVRSSERKPERSSDNVTITATGNTLISRIEPPKASTHTSGGFFVRNEKRIKTCGDRIAGGVKKSEM